MDIKLLLFLIYGKVRILALQLTFQFFFFHSWILKQKFIPFLLLPQDTNTFIRRQNSNIPILCS